MVLFAQEPTAINRLSVDEVPDVEAGVLLALPANEGDTADGLTERVSALVGTADGQVLRYDATTGLATFTDLPEQQCYITLEDAGGDPSGLSDSAAALTAALATGKTVCAGGPGQTFRFDSTVIVPVDGAIFGWGAKFRTESDLSILSLSSGASVQGVEFEANKTGTAQRGIFIDGGAAYTDVVHTRVTQCSFKGFGGAGYHLARSVDKHQGHYLGASVFSDCIVGVQVAERGEYGAISGCNINQCNTGIEITGGNTLVDGCVITDCSDGVMLLGGANDAHGSVSDSLINHCARAVRVINPTVNEFAFNDCKIYFGGIQITGSMGISFNDCVLALNGTMAFDGVMDCYFQGCRFRNIPTTLFNWNGNESRVYFTDSVFPAGLTSGVDMFNINGGLLEVQRTATNLVLGAGVSDMDFNDVIRNSSTGIAVYGVTDWWDDVANKTAGIVAHKSPNSSAFCDVHVALTIGVNAGAVDHDLISAYIVDESSGEILGNLTPSTHESGVNPGLSYKQHVFSGRLPKRNYQVKIRNSTGVSVTVYREQGGLFPSKLIVSGF